MKDIMSVFLEAGTFRMFVSAVQAADLADTLRGGLFTVFAPDDEAFAKLPKGTVDDLLKDMPKLTAVLMYHMIAGRLVINDISKMEFVRQFKVRKSKLTHVNGIFM